MAIGKKDQGRKEHGKKEQFSIFIWYQIITIKHLNFVHLNNSIKVWKKPT